MESLQCLIAREINIADNPPPFLFVSAGVTWYIGCGMRKRYNYILKRPFFTRFAVLPYTLPQETSENIGTDLAEAMNEKSLWGTGREVKQ